MSEADARLKPSAQTAQATITSPAMTGHGAAIDAVPSSKVTPTLAEQAKGLSAAVKNLPPPNTCRQCLKISVFFDGTGNNLKADTHTLEHSNVARMFRAMPLDSAATGIFSRYVPGIGTLFPEIGDPGKGWIIDTHNAMGAFGQGRLDWATKEVQRIVHEAEARAQNPTNKIVVITLAVFGFSRGATLARAFVRDFIKNQCAAGGGPLRWKQGGYPVEISFMGLWDTVAAVGVPLGVNNVGAVRRERFSIGNVVRRTIFGDDTTMLRAADLAFGEPGADPMPGPANGHQSWADGLEIPEAVASCVHMVAAHEQRNSFPLDSVSRAGVKPANCKEIVYPGVHSDVGGGYRPGEGGRGEGKAMDSAVADADKVLGQISLNAMYDEALIAGVPLRQKTSPQWAAINRDDFAMAPAMQASFDHYISRIGRGAGTLGAKFLAHTRLYFAWRFSHIREKQSVRPDIEADSPNKTAEEQQIAANEKVWAQDEKALDKQIAVAKTRRAELVSQRMNEQIALSRKPSAFNPVTMLPTSEGQAAAQAISAKYDVQIADQDRQIAELTARKETLPSRGTLTKGLSTYDAQLLDDVRSVLKALGGDPKLRARLRPHYKNLVETYEDEYVHNRGLKRQNESDKKIIEFFERYVHDSLADFQMDSTLPSDPRVIYIGGAERYRYAKTDPTGATSVQAA